MNFVNKDEKCMYFGIVLRFYRIVYIIYIEFFKIYLKFGLS